MRTLLFSIFLLSTYLGMSQAKLNNYKYIIVPAKFDAFKQENQYQTSTLIKHLLVENGFNAVYDNALPDDLLSDRCLGLLLGLTDDSSMFRTKVALTLKDCFSKEIYRTKDGSSKEKEYRIAYSEAIKESIKSSLSGAGYTYNPGSSSLPVVVSYKDDVKQQQENTVSDAKNVPSPPIVQQKATLEEQSYKSMEPVPSNITKANVTSVLYAQAIPNGFQLVDSTPKIKYKILRSSQADVFLAEGDGHQGIVLKKGDNWYFEYYDGEQLMAQELSIKF